jgi:hypothetical protein
VKTASIITRGSINVMKSGTRAIELGCEINSGFDGRMAVLFIVSTRLLSTGSAAAIAEIPA